MSTKDKKSEGKGLKNEHGFTLLEILLAVFILSVGLLGVATMQVSGTQGTARAKWHTGATVLASDRIEKLMSLPYDHADLADGAHAGVTEDKYSISWNVAEDELIDNSKTITVTVSRVDWGRTRDVSFVYYKTDI